MNSENKNVIIAGGGSGGHIFPALSIADALVKSGIDIDRISFLVQNIPWKKLSFQKVGIKYFYFLAVELIKLSRLKIYLRI